jgi:hypothetical protein
VSDFAPGDLDGTSGAAERGGKVIASVELRDSRLQTYIEVPMPGGKTGKKPGHVTGAVSVRFAEVEDTALRDHLGELAGRKRPGESIKFDIVLDSGERLQTCTLAGPLGSDNGGFWFVLDP